MHAIRRLLIGFLALSAPSALALQRRCEPGESCQTIIPSVVTQTSTAYVSCVTTTTMISDRVVTQTLWDTQVVTSTISEKDSETISVLVIEPRPSVISAVYTSQIVLSTDIVVTSYGVTTIDGTTSTTTWTGFATPTATPSQAESASAWTHTAIPAYADSNKGDVWATPKPTVTAIGGGSVFGSVSEEASLVPFNSLSYIPSPRPRISGSVLSRQDVNVAMVLSSGLLVILAVGVW